MANDQAPNQSEKQKTSNRYSRTVWATFIILAGISVLSLVTAALVARSTANFTSQCNAHWLTQIESVCPIPAVRGYTWQAWNATPAYPIPEIVKATGGNATWDYSANQSKNQ